MDVPPFPHPPVREKMVPAELAERGFRFRGCAAAVAASPDIEEGREVGSGVLEPGVRLIGLRLLVRRSLPRILDGEGRGDDRHLREALLLSGFDDHPRYPRIEGEPRHDPPPLRQPPGMGRTALILVFRFYGAELQEDLDPVPDALLRGTVDEGKGVDVAEVEGEHPEDHARQVGAEDLRRRVEGAAEVLFLPVEAYADPVLDAAAAAFALIGAASGDRPDGKARRPGAGIVLGDPGQSRIDHVSDPGDRDRRLRHVGRDDDLPSRERPEDPLLLCCGETREEGENRRLFPEAPVKETRRSRGCPVPSA